MNQNRCQEPFSETWQQIPDRLASFALPRPFQCTGTIRKYPRIQRSQRQWMESETVPGTVSLIPGVPLPATLLETVLTSYNCERKIRSCKS
jgi:hypothetical protein